MSVPKNMKLKTLAGIAVSFTSLVVIVIFLAAKRVVSFQMALLMLVALVALYFGFGVLIAIYRFTGKLK